MDQMFEDPAFMHRAISVRGQMVIPVGAILHSFSKQIHAAYGHASQGGDWRWALRRAHWQDRRCFKKMLVPGHRKHSRPKVLTGHISLPGMFPHLGKSEAAGAPWQGVSTPVLRKKKEGGGTGDSSSLPWAISMRAEEPFILIYNNLGWKVSGPLSCALSLFPYHNVLELSFCSPLTTPHCWTHPSWRD